VTTRYIYADDWVKISEDARRLLGLENTGPYLVKSIFFVKGDDRACLDIGFGRHRAVFEDHASICDPPTKTLLEKELAAQEGWQRRRDANLRNLFVPKGL